MTDPIRVHLVHQGFGDYVDGLLDGLESLGRQRVDVSVTTITSGPAPLTALRKAHDEHRAVALARFRDPRSAFLAGGAVRKILSQPCDLVHWQAAGNPWVDLAFLRWLRSGQRTTPAVVTVHDMLAHPGDKSVLPGTFPVIRRIARSAERVIVHAAHIRSQAEAAGVTPSRLSVLPHGELATRYVSPEALPLPLSQEQNVLFFGRAQWYKGLDVAAEAMETVASAVPGAKLIVAGSGPSIDEVFPEGKPIPSWCELHRGKVPSGEVAELFSRATVVILPYREASQSGVAALAAGFGRPVVASRLPGLIDCVDDEGSGLLVEPGRADALADALIRVLLDPPLAHRLAAGASLRAQTDLSWTTIGGDLLDLYHGVVSAGVGDGREGRSGEESRPTSGR